MKQHLWIASILCSLAVQADALRLDFGTGKSPVRDGFQASSPAVSWSAGASPSAKASPIQREWKYSESSGRNYPPSSYSNELSCDHLESADNAELVLQVPDGAYRIWLLCGAAGGNASQVWDTAVSCGNDEAKATFAGGYEIRKLLLRATAQNGHMSLKIQTRSRWVLNALVAVPEAEWQETETELLKPLETEIFVLPPDVLKEWKELPSKATGEMPEFTKDETERGLVVHRRSYLDVVWPDTPPRRRDIDQPVRAYAARDEYEPMTFSLFPLRDFASVDVRLAPFVSTSGQELPMDDLDLRYVRYLNVRPNYRTYRRYYRAPDVLMPWQPRPLIKGENLRLWLTVYTGPAAKEGIYRSTAEIVADGKTVAQVPLVFRVLPIHLQKDQTLVYGQYYRHPYRRIDSAPDAFSREWWRRKAELEHIDMARHGNNTLVLGLGGRWAGDRWTFQFDRLGRAIDLYRRVGFDKPIVCSFPFGSLYWKYMRKGMGSHLRLVEMPPPELFAELTEMVRQIETEARRRQWPELLYYPVDEPSTSENGVQFMTEVMKAIKRVPNVRTYVTADPAHVQFAPMKPYVDVWCCQPFSIPRDELVADMKKRGVEYWCYPNHVAGENDHTTVSGARMTYGFGFWRSGFRALTPWIYQSIQGDQWNYLDGDCMDFFNRTDDDASPIPVSMWEAYREGIDDGRYITTLQRTIARAREAGKTALADAAQADLDLVWNAVRVQEKYKEDDLWDPDAYDVYRWLIASRIIELQSALGD
jgi:hypothetical protein